MVVFSNNLMGSFSGLLSRLFQTPRDFHRISKLVTRGSIGRGIRPGIVACLDGY